MKTSVQTFIQMCQWDSAKFLIISDNVFDSLVYYSHILPLVAALFFSIFVHPEPHRPTSTSGLGDVGASRSLGFLSDGAKEKSDRRKERRQRWCFIVQ